MSASRSVNDSTLSGPPNQDRRREPRLPRIPFTGTSEADEPEGTGASRWLLTYADMITLLLAFFIVLAASSIVNQERISSVGESIRSAFRAPPLPERPGGSEGPVNPSVLGELEAKLASALGPEIGRSQVELEMSERGLVIRLSDATLFELGKADLTLSAKGLLDRIVPFLASLPNMLEVEGHTDNLPIRTAQYPSNWELSTARATSVVRYLMNRYGISPLRLTARGMGKFRPLLPNHATRGQPRNRRVEFLIVR
ncbi:MAG: flagellar motor protein MotB [Candidatus Methylomirabilia bacterium]